MLQTKKKLYIRQLLSLFDDASIIFFHIRFYTVVLAACSGRMDGAAEARVLRIDCHNEAKNYPLLWHSPPSLSHQIAFADLTTHLVVIRIMFE